MARCAHRWLANFYFQWRYERLDEVKLSDRTDIFAEGGAAKQTVNNECRCEICNGYPGRHPRTVPQREGFIAPQKQDNQSDRQPFTTKPARPGSATRQPTTCERTRQRE